MIKKIKVKNLFDYYSFEVNLMNSGSKITIIHAPNGYGKTTMFRLTKALLSFDVLEMMSVPFSKFTVTLSNDIVLGVENRKKDTSEGRSFNFLKLSIKQPNGEKSEFTIPNNYRIRDEIIRYGDIETVVRRRNERYSRSYNELNGTGVKSEFAKQFDAYSEAFSKATLGVKVDFIGSNRLYKSSANQTFSFTETIPDKVLLQRDYLRRKMDDYEYIKNQEKENESIVEAAKDILAQIQNTRQKYSLDSEKMDRDFPNRLVKGITNKMKPLEVEEIYEKIQELSKKRKELEEAGLALTVDQSFLPAASEYLDETLKLFYTLYIHDTFDKLSLYDDIKSKLELFMKIINEKTVFSNKKMRIDSEKGVIFEPINSNTGVINQIPLEKLSSGEKHDFILFYELIFKSPRNSIVLIDEPEISLHVAWQMEFVNILEEICKMNGVQAVIATHSPDIVNGRNDLLVSLDMGDNR